MFGKLVCWWKGKHKRGVKDGAPFIKFKGKAATYPGQYQKFKCPRCGEHTHTRKAKAAT